MTRCVYLDSWFDIKSKEIDMKEEDTKMDFVTGKKFTLREKIDRAMKNFILYMGGTD